MELIFLWIFIQFNSNRSLTVTVTTSITAQIAAWITVQIAAWIAAQIAAWIEVWITTKQIYFFSLLKEYKN